MKWNSYFYYGLRSSNWQVTLFLKRLFFRRLAPSSKRDVTKNRRNGVRGSKLVLAGLTILRNEVAFIQLFFMEKHLVEILRRLKISLRFLKTSLVKKDTYRNKCSIVTKQGNFGKKCLGPCLSRLKKRVYPATRL
ncbi:hypothetical protein NPIL_589861 [Nephila pilipes]|uniref:Uncharacterized protein n=1 Tax=Nephila pilipes TaxID=299642 RepID=A0A8X6KBJ5_NEPPI|nr:hypothetical protein NPIL_589861 [Nephila pilipes]